MVTLPTVGHTASTASARPRRLGGRQHRQSRLRSRDPCGSVSATATDELIRVQMRRSHDFARIPVHSTIALARAGTSGEPQRLPHMAEVQRAFGGHDLGRVDAHLDRRAAAAAHALGRPRPRDRKSRRARRHARPANRRARSDDVVQQRAGVQLDAGVGRAGDAFEQHGDQVAEAVVRGSSAGTVLDRMGLPKGPAASAVTAAVQRQPAPSGVAAADPGVDERAFHGIEMTYTADVDLVHDVVVPGVPRRLISTGSLRTSGRAQNG